MNFKILSLLFLVSSCGVKGNPVAPDDANVPSVLENYPDVQLDQPLKDSEIKRN